MDQAGRMGREPIAWLLLKFSLPAMLGTMMNAAYNLVDRIFVGRSVGDEGLAALTVSFPIMMIMMGFGMMFGFGSNALISIRLGQNRRDDAEKILGQGVCLFTILAAVFMVFAFSLMTPLLRLFGATDNILPYARQYMTVIVFGVFFHEISFGVNGFIRGEGNPSAAMITMLLGSCGNIFLDWLFVWRWGWGVQGAALATILAQGVAASWVFYYYLSGRSLLKLRWKYYRIDPRLTRRVMILGFPPFFMNIASCVQHAFMNNRLATYGALTVYGGDKAIAVMGGIFSILMVVIMPIIGLSQGMQPLVGYNFGAKNHQRVSRTLRTAMTVGTLICTASWLILFFAPEFLFSLFAKDDPEFIELGAHAVRRFMFCLPLIGMMIISTNYFLATKRPLIALSLSVLRQALLLIPLVIFLPRRFGLDGVWMAAPISDFGAFIMTNIVVFIELRRLKRLATEESELMLTGFEDAALDEEELKKAPHSPVDSSTVGETTP
jgi:putative MATE family efflux protein